MTKQTETTQETKTLIYITSKAMALASEMCRMAVENDGEIPESIDLQIQENDQDLAHKIESYSSVIEILESQMKLMKEKSDYFYNASKRIESRISFLESRLVDAIRTLQVDRLEGIDVEYKMVKNPPKVEILDEKLVPQEFKKETVKVEVKIDKKAIMESHKMGFSVEGTEVVTELRLKKSSKK